VLEGTEPCGAATSKLVLGGVATPSARFDRNEGSRRVFAAQTPGGGADTVCTGQAPRGAPTSGLGELSPRPVLVLRHAAEGTVGIVGPAELESSVLGLGGTGGERVPATPRVGNDIVRRGVSGNNACGLVKVRRGLITLKLFRALRHRGR